MKNSILKMYAVTPCHAGSGSALGTVDLPIQRERHTNWPLIQASGMKGAMRAHFDRYKTQESPSTEEIFGTDKDSGYAGSFSVSDAKILAFPMRSNVAPFVWITCPAILKRLKKDIKLIGNMDKENNIPVLSENDAQWVQGTFTPNTQVILEDMVVSVGIEYNLGDEVAKYFKEAERLLIVSDSVFDYGVSNCTQVMAQIKIEQSTGTTSAGSLRYQEELPADTLMYAVVQWGDGRGIGDELKSEVILKLLTETVMKTHLQVGGDETLGRGIFELEWIKGGI